MSARTAHASMHHRNDPTLHVPAIQAKAQETVNKCYQSSLDSRRSICGSNTTCAAFLLLSTAAVFVVVAFTFIRIAPSPAHHVLDWTIYGENAFCIDMQRGSHFPTVQLSFGHPMRTYNLLLRVDRAMNSTHHVAITQPSALLSASISCSIDSNQLEWCHDTAIVYTATAVRSRRHAKISFRYGERAVVDTHARDLRLDGEITLCADCAHTLLARELCIGPSFPMDGQMSKGLPVEIGVGGVLATNVEHMRVVEGPWSDSAAAASPCDANATVMFMPATAFVESANTMFTTSEVQEIAGISVLRAFREVLEAGQTCAARQEHLTKQVSTFGVRCAGAYADTSACTPHAAVTFHRTSARRLLLNCGHGQCLVHTQSDASLESLPDRDDHSSATATAWSRLLLMLLAASIVWIRSNDATASIDVLYHKMLVFARGDQLSDGSEPTINRSDVMLDARMVLLGGLACTARILVVMSRRRDFHADGQYRLIVVEQIAAWLSVVHWFALASDYVVVNVFIRDVAYAHQIDGRARGIYMQSCSRWISQTIGRCIWRGDALASLGGSAAVVDVSCATMIAFTDTPIRAGSNNFDAVARLLTAVLISLTGICRCWFSVSTSGVLLQHDHSTWGRRTAVVGIIYWLVQTVAIAASLTDLFVTPLALHTTRHIAEDHRWMAVAILAFMITLAGPRITANAQGISKIGVSA